MIAKMFTYPFFQHLEVRQSGRWRKVFFLEVINRTAQEGQYAAETYVALVGILVFP